VLEPLRTVSLVLRPFAESDLPALYAFMSNPAAMQHTYVATTSEHCLARLSAYEAMRPTLGFAPWVARNLSTHEVVGWGGLSIDPQEPE
jgi:[ribosomal protein S5]-alanine N-acetyltransferase